MLLRCFTINTMQNKINIYKIINLINGKSYIGQTVSDIEKRYKQHTQKCSGCRRLKEAFEEFGKDNFRISLIDQAETEQEAFEKEALWIKKENTLYPNGYNLLLGGFSNGHTEDTKQKMSQTRKGKHPRWATEASTSLEARTKRSESHKQLGSSVWTEERRFNAQIGAMKRAKPISDQNGIIYNSLADAARKTGCHRSAIQKVLKGEYKQASNKEKQSFVFKHIE